MHSLAIPAVWYRNILFGWNLMCNLLAFMHEACIAIPAVWYRNIPNNADPWWRLSPVLLVLVLVLVIVAAVIIQQSPNGVCLSASCLFSVD